MEFIFCMFSGSGHGCIQDCELFSKLYWCLSHSIIILYHQPKRYSRDRYIRPYEKNTFLREMEDVNLITFEAEFSELEQLAVDTIQRRVSHSMLPINRKRNRYQGMYIMYN